MAAEGDGPSMKVTPLLPAVAGLAALAAGLICVVVTGSALAAVAAAAVTAAGTAMMAVRWSQGRAIANRPAPAEEGRQAAEAERVRLRAALDTVADGVIGLDRQGVVVFMNKPAEALLQRRFDEVAGRTFAWLMPDPDAVEAVEECLRQGVRRQRAIETPNHQLLEVTAAPLNDAGDWAAIAVARDITELRGTEQMRRDFVANVSHELRTPLASIKAVLETLEGGAMTDPEAARDFIARAETEVDRLTTMLTDLLELSRLESGEVSRAPEDVDIGRAVSEAVERLRSQAVRAGIELAARMPSEPATVTGDEDRIERAVMNLIQNAIKFTHSGGRIDVHTESREGWVAIEVIDNGPGIDERDLPRVFERFYKGDNSRRTPGSGLGLALVKHTAEAHGGRVTVESVAGRGSKFTILLPATDRIALEKARARGQS